MNNNLMALGLELNYREDDFLTVSPINVLVVAEGMDSDGDTTYVVMHTPGMTSVSAGALVNFAKIWTDLNIMNDLISGARNVDTEEK